MRLESRFRSAAPTAALLAAVMAGALDAQQVGSKRFDPATGTYFVTIQGDSGLRELQVHPANGARGILRVSATQTAAAAWRYRYTLVMSQDTRQSLDLVELPCPRSFSARNLTGTAYSRANGISSVLAELPSYSDREVCEFLGNAVVGGDSLILEFTADAAPGIGMAHLIGKKPGVVWPVEYDEAENGRAKAVIDSLSGHTGGWYDVTTVAPVRSSATLTAPSQTAGAVADDLNAACGPLVLIGPAGICNSLRAKLDAARQSIERGNANAAKGQVSALLLELDAQRGEHVKEPAYIVLHTLALLLQSQLAR